MSDDRRFDEAEVGEIFERATSHEAKRLPAQPRTGVGLTLAQLQDIGAEVGIEPAQIAAAAAAISRRTPGPAPRAFLGAPRSVSRIVPIPRALDDDEWTRLVVALREAFGATGRIRVHGALRSWENGNLQVHVEPDGDRFRVRMQTLKGDTIALAALGATTMGMSGVMFLVQAAVGLRPGGLVAAAIIGVVGLGQLLFIRARLPRWASERTAQMEGLAEVIEGLTGDREREDGSQPAK